MSKRRNIAFNASGFKEAADHLNKLISKNGATLLEYGPAYTTNLSLSCELYFKALLCDDTTGHGLVSLFKKVDDSIKKSIIRNYENKCQEYNKRSKLFYDFKTLDECLREYDNAFEDWRYYYEGNKKSNLLGGLDLSIFIDCIEEEVDKLEEL